MGLTMGTTNIAIVSGCSVKVYQANDHGHESRQARSGVDLLEGADKARIFCSRNQTRKEMSIITDPYRPAVGLTPSDGTPLEVKSGGELPAGSSI